MNAAKDFSQEICSHTDLLDLDQNQGYTAISNKTMFHLLSNTKIASALKLWLFIRFKQSGFKDRSTYTVTIRDLSEHLGVGKSTIQNWQRILVSEGYLDIRARKTSLRSNLANQYRACLPKKIQEELKGEGPQRGSTTHAKKSTRDQKEIGKNRSEGNKITSDTKVYSCSYNVASISDSKSEPKTNQRVQNKEHENIKAHIIHTLTTACAPRWLLFLCQGLSMSLSEEGALCLFNVPDHAKQPLTDFFNENKEFLIAGNRSLNGSLQLLSTNNSESSPLPQATKRTNTRPKPTPTPTPATTHNVLTTNRSKQQITQHTRQRIYKRLHNLKHHGRRLFAEQQLNKLVAEVIFSVTEGAFSSVATTKAINICIKLIIENRWTTPYQLTGGSLNT